MKNVIGFKTIDNQYFKEGKIIKESDYAEDISFVLSYLCSKNVPINEILEFKYQLSVNKTITNNIKRKFDKWFDDQLFKFLINRKLSFYGKLIDKLSVFDLYTLEDVKKNHTGFKLDSLYLAGGMDEAKNLGKGWRSMIEYEFEIINKGKRNTNLDKIKFSLDNKEYTIHPAYIVDGKMIDNVKENPKKYLKLYDKPAVFNPIRAEIKNRTSKDFKVNIGSFKDPNYDPTKDIKPFEWISETFGTEIEPGDEHLIRISDAIFLGQDSSAGAGTYGELELISLMKKPIFAWLVNESENKIGSFKLWTTPHLSKVARNEKEMEILVKTICKEAKNGKY